MEVVDKLIYESTVKIIEPISEQVSRKVLDFLGITDFFKDNIYLSSDYTTITKYTKDNRRPKINENRCDIVFVPNYNPSEVKFSFLDFRHASAYGLAYDTLVYEYPIFQDPKDNISLYEYNLPCSIDLEFSLKLKSIELADIVVSSLYHKFENGSVVKYHDLQYSYPIPDIFVYIMYKLYRMKDFKIRVPFKDYLKIGSNSSIDLLVDRNNLNQKQLNILKTQVYALGIPEIDLSPPEADKKNQVPNRFIVNFKYTIQFAKPNLLRLMYPLVINNQPIPEEFINKTKDPDEKLCKSNVSVVCPFKPFNNYFNFEKEAAKNIPVKYATKKYPEYDKITAIYDYTFLHKKYQPIFQGILEVEKGNNPTTPFITLDLKNDIFPLLSEEQQKLIEDLIKIQGISTFKFSSGINITLFTNSTIIEPSKIEFDGNKLFIYDRLDPNATHRVSINLRKNLKFIDQNIIYTFLDHHEYTDVILQSNFTYLLNQNYIEIVESISPENGNFLTKTSDVKLSKIYLGTPTKGVRHGPYAPFRIGNFLVRTIRK